MDERRAFFVNVDGSRVKQPIFAFGGSGIVLLENNHALKLPRISRVVEGTGPLPDHVSLEPAEGNWDERGACVHAILAEKNVYARLGQHRHIIRCYNTDCDEPVLRLEYAPRGTLHTYLARARPDQAQICTWAEQILMFLNHCHSHNVLYNDLRLDNLLLDDDLSIKAVDFGNATVMNPNWNGSDPDDLGYSVQSDLAEFAAVLFELVTGRRCSFELLLGEANLWPDRTMFPPTDGLWLGSVIDRCWSKHYLTVEQVLRDLQHDATFRSDCNSSTGAANAQVSPVDAG